MGQGEQRGGDCRVGDGEDQARVAKWGCEKGRVWVAWGQGRDQQGSLARALTTVATVGSSVFVIIGRTLHPVTWHRVGTWTCLLKG